MSALAHLQRAWWVEIRDPLGIGLPTIGLLALDLALLLALRVAWQHGVETLAAVWAATVAARWVLSAPLRAQVIRAGARVLGAQAVGGTLALVGTQILSGIAVILAGLCFGAPLVVAGSLLVWSGWLTLGTVGVAIGVAMGTFAGFAARAACGFAPIEAVMHGRAAFPAVVHSLRGVRGAPSPVVLILLIRDAIVTIGGFCCGAGMIPGHPLSDLALLDRHLQEDRC